MTDRRLQEEDVNSMEDGQLCLGTLFAWFEA